MFASYVSHDGRHNLANNAYLSEMQYSHRWVNHRRNFIDPETGANTQRVEGAWEVRIKQYLKRMRGIQKESIDSYLDEFLWRSWYFPQKPTNAEFFMGFIQGVKKYY